MSASLTGFEKNTDGVLHKREKKNCHEKLIGVLGLLQPCEVKERGNTYGVLLEREKTNCHEKLNIIVFLVYFIENG